MPTWVKILVLTQFDLFQVVWNRIGELNQQLLQWGFAVGLRVQAIKRLQSQCNGVIAHVICQCNEIKVIASRISLENQYPLDAKNLALGGHSDLLALVAHRRCFERFIPDQLPNPCFDPIQAPENLHGALNSGGFPASHRFKFLEHLIEATTQVSQNVICITREPMICVKGGRGTADEHRIRKDALKSGRR